MIGNGISRENVEEMLRDSGCPDEFIGQFMGALDTGRVNDQLQLLRAQRGRQLELVHMEEKRLDQLDFLRYKLEQQAPEVKTPRRTKTARKGCGL